MLVKVVLLYAIIWTILLIFLTYFLFILYDTHKLIPWYYFSAPPLPACGSSAWLLTMKHILVGGVYLRIIY